MRPKGMEDLAAFKVREVKRAAGEERERDGIPLLKDSESQNKRQSHPSELFENRRKGGLVGAVHRREG